MKYRNIFTKEDDVKKIREAAKISSEILKSLKENVKIGNNAKEINDLALKLCSDNKVIPAFKGVLGPLRPFPASVCVSVNDEVLHGIPTKEKVFKDGDIVKVDFGIIYEGFYTDHCVTVGLGQLDEKEKLLISVAQLCVDTAVKHAVSGNTVNDISYALQTVAQINNFNFVTTYCGHGIGKSLHESPEVPSWTSPDLNIKLVDGMVLCIENQITTGSAKLKIDDDGWTLRTVDGSKGAMFEHMVIVRKRNPEILTSLGNTS